MADSVSSTPPKPIPHLSGLPLLGSALDFQKDKLEVLFRVARECGEIGTFRVGPKTILLACSAELIQAVLEEKHSLIHRGPYFDMFIPVMGTNSLVCIDGDYHRQQRKLHMPAFGHRRMPKYAEAMMECIQAVVNPLKDGQHLDLGIEMGRLARMVTAKTLFNLDEGPEAVRFQYLISLLEQYMSRLGSSVLPLPLWVPTPTNRETSRAIVELHNRADEIIREHKARNQDMGDLLSMLLQARNEDGSPLSDTQLREHTLTMYMAGQETTAVALTWMSIHLAQNPHVQVKLQEEVDRVLQGRAPTFEDLPQLSYCGQVVKESLRMSPPVGVVGRESRAEVRLGDYVIPPKQFMLVSSLVVQRSAKYYSDPERFNPDHFKPEVEKTRPRSAFLPFGTGVHTCVGNHIAVMEMHLAVAYMMQRMTLELEPGQDIRHKMYVTVKPTSSRFIIRGRTAQPLAHAG
jgi:cytochrome P450